MTPSRPTLCTLLLLLVSLLAFGCNPASSDASGTGSAGSDSGHALHADHRHETGGNGGAGNANVSVNGDDQTPIATPDPVSLTVIHYNDFHATFEPRTDSHDGKKYGGIAWLASAIKAARARAADAGETAIVADAGDFATGQVLHMVTRGRATLEFHNLLAPDVFVPGNHEFDMGDGHFVRLYGGQLGTPAPTFPVVCANVTTPGQPWKPHTIIERNGLRIGVIGINTPELKSQVIRNAVDATAVEAIAPAVTRSLQALAGQTDIVIVLSHAGVEVDQQWAPAFAGKVHLVVSGHCHTTLPKGLDAGGVPLVSAGAFGRWLGRARITVDRVSGRLIEWTAGLESLRHEESELEPDSAAADLLTKKLEGLVEQLKRKVAVAAEPLSNSANPEAPLGTWEAQAMLDAVPVAELGLINPYGVRKSLAKGDVTAGDLMEVNPFRNTLVTLRLTGAEILRATSRNLLDGQDEETGKHYRRRPLQWAGARIEYNLRLKPDERVVRMWVGGKLIEPARDYVVVTNNYIASQTEKYFHTNREIPSQETGLIDVDVFLNAAEKAGTLRPRSEDDAVYHEVAPPDDAELATPEDTGYVVGRYRVTAVYDGDTVRVAGLGESLRFLGIDTEETFKNSNGHTAEEYRKWAADDFAAYAKKMRGDSVKPVKFYTPMGEAAKEYVQKVIDHSPWVRLEYDDPDRKVDVYGRYLVYVMARRLDADNDDDMMNLNLELVRLGYTPYYLKYGRLSRFHEEFLEAEKEARDAKRGIWSPQPTPGVPDHYPDYAERDGWWRRCFRALERYAAVRAEQGDDAPLKLEDGFDKHRLAENVGKVVEVFGRVRGVNEGDHQVEMGLTEDAKFHVEFGSAANMNRLWERGYDGEVLVVRGKLAQDGRNFTITPTEPGDIVVYGK